MSVGSCLFLPLDYFRAYTNSNRIVIGELCNYKGHTPKIGVSV